MTLLTELGLEDRCKRVIARMAVLADASGPSALAFVGEGRAPRHGDSRVPAGASLRHREGPPSSERSLVEHWRYRFEHARSDHHLWSLCVIAEREYITARYGGRTPESMEAMNERVIREYEGMPPLEVALIEGTNERWVRKLRVHAGRNPDTGREAERTIAREDRARALRAQGMSYAEIGRQLGVSHMTASRMVKGAA